MKNCIKCGVKLNTTRKTCPLCGQLLEGQDNENQISLYPKYVNEQKHINLLQRILLYISILAILISVLINFLTYRGVLWSIYVVLGVLYGWILLRLTIMSRTNIAGRLLIQLIATSLVTYGVERVSQSENWALEYVVPFLCIITMIAILIILLIKKMKLTDYIYYLILAVLISWVPMILYWTKVVTVLWPSIAAAGVGVAIILGMIIFADTATKDELKKRFHI
ncbi:MAG TPA: hypothetical protein GXZ48_06290 [Acholeplasmataceae bacterium]|jgi:hypothetical protein|nr:hypothetical protein [Acholeplasmataceae bacterium]